MCCRSLYQLPGNRVAQHPCLPMGLNPPLGVSGHGTLPQVSLYRSLVRRRLRPELQALFERLSVDPYSELFVRSDGMVQSGPDPVFAEAPLNAGEARTSNVDSSHHFVVRKKFQSAS